MAHIDGVAQSGEIPCFQGQMKCKAMEGICTHCLMAVAHAAASCFAWACEFIVTSHSGERHIFLHRAVL